MRRLQFTLPCSRTPLASCTSGSNNGAEPPCTFDELANLMDPEPNTTATVWRKAVDRDQKALLFYQLDLGDDDLVADKSVRTVLPVAPIITSIMDVVRLLQYVELYPATPDDDLDSDKQVKVTHEKNVTPPVNLVEKVSVEKETHLEDEDNRCDDLLSGFDVDSDDATPAAPEKNALPNTPKTASKRLPLPEPELNDAQIAYAKLVKHSLSQPGRGKVEIYPDAGIYAPSKLLKRIRDRYLKQCTKQNNDRVRILNSKGPGSVFAVELMDSLGKFTDKVHWDHTAQVFDEEYLTKVARFIDLNHPEILNGSRPSASVQEIRKAIRVKLRHYHQNREKRANGYKYKPKKERRNPRTQPVSGSALNVSLISPAGNIPWNPLLPFNHPDFWPSYLFPRQDYVPLIQGGNVPPVYIKNSWRDYFISAQSRNEYPKMSRWIRALMYQIMDQQAIFHMYYLEKKQEDEGKPKYVYFHQFVSTGFIKTIEEFINNHTSSRDPINRDALTAILRNWFRENQRTVVKKKILNDDPSSVNINSKIVVGLRYKKIVGLK
ncbi:uncharacterized protein LOC129594324 isoform X2 [Paramacrobiotus metropolitanus]|uniref:uncharacterized protein LOC129594324 isoform X2 n=1 Tax=Paramacrobiotus metropolitanus TaxID=2943436 RepID=UPI002445CE6E|nr:uncharacterized protein LOC129594324 isoform X2 [Paramacrobiotus metropolitanus]